MARPSRTWLRAGAGALEALIGTLILSVAIVGATSGVMTGIAMTERAEGLTVSGQLARQAMETTRGQGFYGAPEGSVTRYYDENGTGGGLVPNDSANKTYSVTTTVTSDRFEVSNGVTTPTDSALRAVIVTVRDNNARLLDSIGTTLARGGL